MLIQKQILVFIFSCLFVSFLQAQISPIMVTNENYTSPAELLLQEIKNGVLVVKVPTGSKVLHAMDKVLEKEGYNSRIETMRNKELNRIKVVQMKLIDGFKQFYTFSPFICVYDSNYLSLLNNPKTKGIFYDENLNLVPSYSLEGKSFGTFREDQYFYDEQRASIGYVVTDKEGQLPPQPFPYAVPYKFKRFPLLPNGQDYIFGIGSNIKYETNQKYKARYSWKYFDLNPYYAVVKFLQTKLDYFDLYLASN